MDIFFEQIVKMKMGAKELAIYLGSWLAAGLVAVLSFFVLTKYLGSLVFILLVGAVWGAWKLSNQAFVEYEYIFTNGDLDIDKITAKSSRKRMVSVNCGRAERYGKYNPAAAPSGSVTKVYTFCDVKSEDAMYMIVPHKSEGNVMIIFAPDERLKGAIEKAIPRIAF